MVAKLDPGAASGDDGDYPFEPEDVQALIDNRGHPLVAAFIKALQDGDEGDSSGERAKPEDDDEGGGKKAHTSDPLEKIVILENSEDSGDESEPENGGSDDEDSGDESEPENGSDGEGSLSPAGEVTRRFHSKPETSAPNRLSGATFAET